MDVVITISGVGRTTAVLDAVKAATLDMSDIMEEIGQDLLSFFENDVFDTQGGALGETWAALAESTVAQKLRRYGDQPILVATGLMRASYQLYTASQWLIIQNEAQNEKGDYYAKYHQEGTNKMPKRLLVDIPDDKMDMIRQRIIDSITQKTSEI